MPVSDPDLAGGNGQMGVASILWTAGAVSLTRDCIAAMGLTSGGIGVPHGSRSFQTSSSPWRSLAGDTVPGVHMSRPAG